jgi:polyphosphate kinase
MNGLSSPSIINALYHASQCGVKIELIIRGICCLKPGLKGISDNIKVRSVVGRFLEHGRVYYFKNNSHDDSNAKLFLSSADWMPRNLRNRIEHCVPVKDEKILETILTDLHYYLADDSDAWIMQTDGSYIRAEQAQSENPENNAQTTLLNVLTEDL